VPVVTGAWGVLRRNPGYRRLFLASVISLGGDWFSFVAVASLMIELTGRDGAAGYAYAATVLPVFLASPVAGPIVDRFDRRCVMVWADLGRVPIAGLLCVAAWQGSVALALIAVAALGVGASFFDPASSAATPNLVAEEDLATAQALSGAVWGTMLLVGAGLGGLVTAALGRYAAFLVDGGSFLCSALLVMSIRRPMQARAAGEAAPSASLGEAWRFIRGAPLILRLLFAKVGVSSANGTVGLLPGFALHRFGRGDAGTGILFAARGLGALLGPIGARLGFGARPSVRVIVALCGLSTISYAAFYAVIPWSPSFALAAVLVVLAHLGGGAQWSLSTYGLQTATPDALRGRVLALDYGLATLAIGGSALAAAALADAVGPTVTTELLAAGGCAYGIGWLAWSQKYMRQGLQ
jgi:MFS family permease